MLFFIFGVFFLSGCTDEYVKRQEMEVMEASLGRRLNKFNYDLNIVKGAASENREAVQILQAQIQELSNHLGNINTGLKKVDDVETKFNKKMKLMMSEVLKENERLIKEINKTRELAAEQKKELDSYETTKKSSDNDINIYNKTNSADLNTGYYHTVRSGESISEIANMYKVPIDHIIKANGIDNPDTLYVGQKLFIPDQE